MKKKPRINADGDFFIRTCGKCFRAFKTAPICPYCNAPYELTEREIKAHTDIELQRVTEEEAQKAEEKRKQMRREVGSARTLPELLAIAKERGYSPQWAYKMMQVRNRNY